MQGREHASLAMNGIAKVTLLAALLSAATPTKAAEPGDHGYRHEEWHAEFYSKLMRPDTKGSCCNLADCRPTEIRSAGDLTK
jgi:hypothetical protein